MTTKFKPIEWILTSEMHPPNHSHILMFDGDHVAPGWYNTDYVSPFDTYLENDSINTDNITHWAILSNPEPK